MVHQQAAENNGTGSQHMGAITRIDVPLLKQLQVRIVGEHRGLQGVSRQFTREGTLGNPVKLIVDRLLPASLGVLSAVDSHRAEGVSSKDTR